jgi:hypothetical protein
MKKFILFLTFALVCQNQLNAQKIITDPGTIGTAPVPKYNITVTRQDDFSPTTPGYAPTTINLEIKKGSNSQFNAFGPGALPGIYTFPISISLPGFPPPVTYVKVTSTDSVYPTLFSAYYPLSTVVGSHTTISDPNMIVYEPYPGQYGYGVDLYCTAPNQYTMRVTKFLCYICVRPPVSKTANPQNSAVLVPNPSMGFSELHYTASGKETISINVADMNGKIVRAYTTDIEAGLNKLPIDIQNQLGGTYIVQWKSNAGTSGSLKLMKK